MVEWDAPVITNGIIQVLCLSVCLSVFCLSVLQSLSLSNSLTLCLRNASNSIKHQAVVILAHNFTLSVGAKQFYKTRVRITSTSVSLAMRLFAYCKRENTFTYDKDACSSYLITYCFFRAIEYGTRLTPRYPWTSGPSER